VRNAGKCLYSAFIVLTTSIFGSALEAIHGIEINVDSTMSASSDGLEVRFGSQPVSANVVTALVLALEILAAWDVDRTCFDRVCEGAFESGRTAEVASKV
jgi:hypothetical protein